MVATERASPSLSIPSSSSLKKSSIRSLPSVDRRQGPRVKHVCRSAGVLKSLPRATFPVHNHSSPSDNDSDELPLDVYISRAFEKEVKQSEDSPSQEVAQESTPVSKDNKRKKKKDKNNITRESAESSDVINKKVSKKKKENHKLKEKPEAGSEKKEVIANENNHFQEHKEVITAVDEIGKKNSTNDQKQSKKSPADKQSKPKKARCKECIGCRAEDCGVCVYCLDKKKFGGSNVIKQACKYRKCIQFLTKEQVEVHLAERAEVIGNFGGLSDIQKSHLSESLTPEEQTKPLKKRKKNKDDSSSIKTNGAVQNNKKLNNFRSSPTFSSSSSDSSESSNENIDVSLLLSAGNAGHGKPSLVGHKEQFATGKPKNPPCESESISSPVCTVLSGETHTSETYTNSVNDKKADVGINSSNIENNGDGVSKPGDLNLPQKSSNISVDEVTSNCIYSKFF